MIVIGLTGSIGMGKSFAAKCFARLGAAVFDADREVHRLLSKGGEAVVPVSKLFPGTEENDAINRRKLGEIVFNDETKRRKLEEIIHPMVRSQRDKFLKKSALNRKKIVVLDVPLLFEGSYDQLCDYTVVVSAPSFVQKHRVVRRGNIKESTFKKINAIQIPIQEKERLADFVIKSSNSKREVFKQVKNIIRMIM